MHPLTVGQLPVAYERLVEIDRLDQLRLLDLGKLVLDREQALLGFEHFEIARAPGAVTYAGQLGRRPQRLHLGLQRRAPLRQGLLRDESVRSFAEGDDDGLAILRDRLVPEGAALVVDRFEPPAGEERS